MVLGQVLDLAGSANQSDLLEMQRKKTGDLLSCCLEFGAILAAPHERAQMRELGLQLGLAYQLRDDLQDKDQRLAQDEAKCLMQAALQPLKELPARVLEIIHPFFGSCTMSQNSF